MIIKTEQIELDFLKEIDFDLVITSSGYESRGVHLMSVTNINSKINIALGFDNYRDNEVRLKNDQYFAKLNFRSFIASGNSSDSILNILKDIFSLPVENKINILVDYSCMTRIWYAEVLKYFYYSNGINNLVNIYFSYSFSEYIPPPQKLTLNKFVSPINGFYSISAPVKPTVLIIGLGYVESRAFGLAEYFDVLPHLMIADRSFNESFYEEVIKQNSDLISSIPEENVFYYPLTNLIFTETLLNHLCQDLLSDFRIVLAPCGPKPFTLLSLITSLRLKYVDVWRISAGENEYPTDKKALGPTAILKVTFQ